MKRPTGRPRKTDTEEYRRGYNSGYVTGYRRAAEAGGQNPNAMARVQLKRRGVRYNRDVGFEMRCESCAVKGGAPCYWPMTLEFWQQGNMSACRGCLLTAKRLAARRAYWRDPAKEKARVAEYQAANADVIRLKQAARRAENPDEARRKSQEWRDANRVAVRAYRRAYYHRNRAHILARERQRRADERQEAA